MSSCPTCLTALPDGAAGCARCGAFSPGSPLLVTVALSPGVACLDSRYPADSRPPVTPAPDRTLAPATVLVNTSGDARVTVTPAPAGSPDRPTIFAVPPPPPPAFVVKLRVIRGLRIGAEYPVYPGRNIIGRFADKPVDVDLTAIEPDGQVWSSRRHACLTLDRSVLVVEDLNSLNGTWVNGARLRAGGALPLKAGDVIQIGVAQLRVDVEAAPPPG
ncbi:FHA domain-containing protein [Urbifossiella limnaea]|uniref:FHA domain protein n=1 Tax=Urbifossiella limnaea TaxID=2528023 RepID=A0A517XV91_9BACT|nr:FHA domain-containing protein [Urbifossiella limnaea]QDU21416.1 FHA domain protein [Urbifossiella limnaea]